MNVILKLFFFLCDREAIRGEEDRPISSLGTCFCPSIALKQQQKPSFSLSNLRFRRLGATGFNLASVHLMTGYDCQSSACDHCAHAQTSDVVSFRILILVLDGAVWERHYDVLSYRAWCVSALVLATPIMMYSPRYRIPYQYLIGRSLFRSLSHRRQLVAHFHLYPSESTGISVHSIKNHHAAIHRDRAGLLSHFHRWIATTRLERSRDIFDTHHIHVGVKFEQNRSVS